MAISATSAASTATAVSSAVDKGTIAQNFTTFLQLLTTQLKNENPLDPLDTNQFTQQLVQFAQVEQQMQSNEQLKSLVGLQEAAQATTALVYVGSNVVIDGTTTALTESGATWNLNVTKPASATITIKDSVGQTAYSGTFAVNPGDQSFVWDGKGNDGRQWPAGNYTLTATAVDANKQSVAVSTEIQAVVDSVDLTQNPPLLSVNGADYPLTKVKRIVRSGA